MALIQNDGYVVYDEASDDDDEDLDTSEDDEEIFWWEFDRIEANRVRNRKTTDANDFEAEMNRELDNTLSTMHSSHVTQQCPAVVGGNGANGSVGLPSSSSAASTVAKKEVKFYDDAYFDSDSDDSQPDNERKKSKNHPVLSNDDLLYDPDADDDDQRWVDRRRNRLARPPPGQNYSEPGNGDKTRRRPPPPSTSDAVLNCPACMTTLCRDCQRHDLYKGQYRAMFVTNCRVDSQLSLKYPAARNDKRKKTVRIDESSGGSNGPLQNPIALGDNRSYNPVHCSVCNTNVAVYDADEVYHFFNVLASFS